MRGKTIHMCLSVRGALNWDRKMLRQACQWIRNKDGSPFTPDELRSSLMDELAKGHEVLPFGKCDGFDYKTGCPGHEPAPQSDKETP